MRRAHRPSPRAHRSEITGALASFVLMGLTALALVSLPTVLVIDNVAEHHAMAEAVKGGRNVARRLLAPETSTHAITGDPTALARLDSVVRARIRDGSMARIKVWDTTGRVVYCDEAGLIGRRYPLPAGVDGAGHRYRGGRTHDARGPGERAGARWPGRGLRAGDASTGEQLVFETYFPETVVRRAQHDLLAQMAPVALAALVALCLAQLPPALRLARRVQRGRQARERLLAQTVAAGDLERRRLGGGPARRRHPGPRGRRLRAVLVHADWTSDSRSVVEQVGRPCAATSGCCVTS